MLICVKLLRSANAARDICKSRPVPEKLSSGSSATSVIRSEREISEDSYRKPLESLLSVNPVEGSGEVRRIRGDLKSRRWDGRARYIPNVGRIPTIYPY